MKLFLIVLTLGLLLGGCIADQRDGSNGVPFLTPDPSLKTTDSFYAHSGCQYMGEGAMPGYALPAIFGGPGVEAEEPPARDWMNLSEHQEKFNLTTKKITVASSYDLTEQQMRKANLTLRQESWL